MNLWNANCDSKYPKSKRILLQELEIWERTQGGHATAPSPFTTSNNVMRKDFDANEWSNNHDDDFRRLIANARKKSETKIQSAIPVEPPSSSEQRELQQGAQLSVNGARVEFNPDTDANHVVDLSG
jgi:E3 ubiquitin-protein ligase RAD18